MRNFIYLGLVAVLTGFAILGAQAVFVDHTITSRLTIAIALLAGGMSAAGGDLVRRRTRV